MASNVSPLRFGRYAANAGCPLAFVGLLEARVARARSSELLTAASETPSLFACHPSTRPIFPGGDR